MSDLKTDEKLSSDTPQKAWVRRPKGLERHLLLSPQFFRIINRAKDNLSPLELEVAGLIYCPTIDSIGRERKPDVTPKPEKFYVYNDGRFIYPLALFLFNTKTSEMHISEILTINKQKYPRGEFDGSFNPQFGADKDWVLPLNGAQESVTIPAQAILGAWWDRQLIHDPLGIKSFADHLRSEFVRMRHCLYDPHFCVFAKGGVSFKKDTTWVKDFEYLKSKTFAQFTCIGPSSDYCFDERMKVVKSFVSPPKVIELAENEPKGRTNKIETYYEEGIKGCFIHEEFQTETLVDAKAVYNNSAAARHFADHIANEEGQSDMFHRAVHTAQTDHFAIEAFKIAMLSRHITDDLALIALARSLPRVFGKPEHLPIEVSEKELIQFDDEFDMGESISRLSQKLYQKITLGTPLHEHEALSTQQILQIALYGNGIPRYLPGTQYVQGIFGDDSYAEYYLYDITCHLLLKNLVALKRQAFGQEVAS